MFGKVFKSFYSPFYISWQIITLEVIYFLLVVKFIQFENYIIGVN